MEDMRETNNSDSKNIESNKPNENEIGINGMRERVVLF